jgi:hypothetical protein
MASRPAMSNVSGNHDRGTDRRQGGRGGRRRTDQGNPWWQKGLVFTAICVVLRSWRLFRPLAARRQHHNANAPS